MSVSVYTEDQEWLGQAASGLGFHELIEAIGDDDSALGGLVRDGYTENGMEAAADIEEFLKSHPDLDVNVVDTLTNLRELIAKAGDFAILHESLTTEAE